MTAFSRKIKQLTAALLAAVICFTAIPMTVNAEEKVDPDKKGSIIVATLNADKKAIVGGTVTLCQVAALSEDGQKFVFTEDFASFKDPIEKDTDFTPQLAEKLAAKAKTLKNLTTKTIGSKGYVEFSKLPVGVYVIFQEKAAKGYKPIKPFLVSVPFKEKDGKLTYQVNAIPKPETAEKEGTPTPTPTDKPTPTATPSGGGKTPSSGGGKTPSSGGGKLPQTGQLWWPVPVLAICGLFFFLLGMRLKRRNS
ncbi:MAG: hypothetical protein IJJ50_09265 [Lachnospiraceae bacterium]|nr:hypothetical protein [Lachnospiraceae bacterium]